MCGINSKKYAGFAFGGGIDRLAMTYFGIEDIRHLYNGDIRFTSQF
jgi:phenylalanyl-tRNA synthetase alpha chain